MIWEALAVARAAVESGVARRPDPLTGKPTRDSLESRLGRSQEVMRRIMHKAKRNPKRIVFLEGHEPKILRACQVIIDEGIARPIILGAREEVERISSEHHLELKDVPVVCPHTFERLDEYIEEFYRLRSRKGITRQEAARLMRHNPYYFGAMMVKMGDADGLIGGVNQHYPQTIRPALQMLPLEDQNLGDSGALHDGFSEGRHVLRGYDGEHRSHGGATGGNCHLRRGHGEAPGNPAPRGDALFQQFRERPPSSLAQGCQGDPDREGAPSGHCQSTGRCRPTRRWSPRS